MSSSSPPRPISAPTAADSQPAAKIRPAALIGSGLLNWSMWQRVLLVLPLLALLWLAVAWASYQV